MNRSLRLIRSDFRRKADHDALFVLMVSVLVLLGSFGFFFLLILLRILYQAKASSCFFPGSNSICLVFGKQLENNQPDREFIARLDRLIDSGCTSAVLMGGRTPGNTVSEALAGLKYLEGRGFEVHSVHLEQDSQSTLENLRNSRELIRDRTAVIISNRYHLCRCSILATSFAITHELCAAESDFPVTAETFIKCLTEAFYIHWFYSGKYWARLTRNQRMLNKIT
jgi:uncharacterized SAM-binding protein YcdF (DUF218 family)